MADEPTVQLVPETRMTADLDARIRATLVACFPKDEGVFSRTRAWHGSAPAFSAVAGDATTIIAHVGAVDRTIKIGGTPLRVAGIQNVAVRPEHRRRGLMRQLLAAAMDHARAQGYDAGLLFTGPELTAAYGRCGWQSLAGRKITRVDEQGRAHTMGSDYALWYALAVSRLPDGPIDLNGNDW